MAIIGKIRKRSGLLIILIGVAIAGFILQDAVRSTKGFKNKKLGVINGTDITYTEFERKYDEQVDQIKQQQRKENLTSQEMYQVRQTVWGQMVNEILMNKEYDELSIEVCQEEMNDMFYGKFLHQFILQNFTNPKTGQVDRQRIIQIINGFEQMKPEEQKQWKSIEEYIKNDRIHSKYNNLISKAYYLPKAFAKRAYETQNDNVKCRLVSVNYNTISDSTIKLDDKDYQAFYDEHKNEFEQEASRDIDYVMFEVLPSKDDFEATTKQVNQVYTDFQTADKVAEFVNSNSDTRYDSMFVKKGVLPLKIDSAVFNAGVGTFVAPYLDNGIYKMAKLIDVQMRPDSMKARHILISFQGAYNAAESVKRTKEEAKKIADSLRLVVQKDTARFMPIAQASSDDPSAKENKGDLGWFADQQMIPSFNDAVAKGKVGETVVVESPFGYHVINILAKKVPEKKVRVALISRALQASNQTYKNVFAQANKFASENTTVEQFEASIKKQGLNKRTAEYVQPTADNIPGIENARELVRWSFNEETKKNDVAKQVFEFDNKFVVAVVKEVREKGIASLEQVKPRLEYVVKRDKKAAMLIEKMNTALTSTKDLYQLAAKFNTQVDTVGNLNFAGYNLGRKGYEPEVIGTIFSMKKAAVSKAIKGNTGVYIVTLDEIIKAPAAVDYTMVRMQMQGMYQQRLNEINKIIQDKAKIEDNRLFFF
ncbi:MAG: SurA N-terminal domain-containing protein [Bacteroidetes bacterium]|nr:SurA N-terminal domain-containing protein [Bacteroidota bacterium]